MTRQKLLPLLAFLILSFLETTAQQLPVFTQYREYQSFLNPAAVGWEYFTYKYKANVGASYRNQWVGLEDAPTTLHLHGEYLIRGKGSFSLTTGFNLINHQTNPITTSGGYGRISAVFSPNPYYGGLAVGFTVGASRTRLVLDPSDFWEPDPIHNADLSKTKLKPDVGIGIFYYKYLRNFKKNDNFYIGFSIPQLTGFSTFNESPTLEKVRHYYAITGYYFYLNEDSFLEPSVWWKYVPNGSTNVDFNLRLQYAHSFWAGLGYNSGNAVHLEAGVILGNNDRMDTALRIGYSFNHALPGDFKVAFGSTHELNIAYAFDW